MQQWNLSDLAFLRERARLIQAETALQDDKILHFMTRTKRTATELTLVRGDELIEVEGTRGPGSSAYQKSIQRLTRPE